MLQKNMHIEKKTAPGPQIKQKGWGDVKCMNKWSNETLQVCWQL